jgi:hypothetical protein
MPRLGSTLIALASTAVAAACALPEVGAISVRFSPDGATTSEPVSIHVAIDGPHEEIALTVSRPGLPPAEFSAADLDLERDPNGTSRARLTIPPEHTDRRQRWTADLRVRYGRQWVSRRAELAIRNTAPTIAVRLDPPAPDTGEVVTAVVDVTDLDSDPISVTYAWWVDGVPVHVTGPHLPAGATRRGAQVRVQVTAYDGDAFAEPAIAVARVVNRPPTTPQIALGPGPIAGATLHCRVVGPSTHIEGLPVSYRFAWTVDGRPYTGKTETGWHEGDAIPAGTTLPGERWRCDARAFDGLDESPPASETVQLLAWGGPRRFTTCGAVGPTGPTEDTCATHYDLAGAAWSPGEITVQDGIQTWTVPFDGRYRITAAGASGGSPRDDHEGGGGAVIGASFTLKAGDRLSVVVGQHGMSYLGTRWGGGGGATILARDARPLLVAGGGGGASDLESGCPGEAGRGGSAPRQLTSRWTCHVAEGSFGQGGSADWQFEGSGGGGFFGSGGAHREGRSEPGRHWLAGMLGGRGFSDACSRAAGGFGGGGSGDGGVPIGEGEGCSGRGAGGGGGYSGGGAGRFGGGGGSFTIGDAPEAVSGFNQGSGWLVVDVE